MTNVFTAVSSVLRITGERVARFLVAIPINLVTIPAGVVIFLLGSVLRFIAPDTGSSVTMTGLDVLQWGWEWWPADVDVDWKV